MRVVGPTREALFGNLIRGGHTRCAMRDHLRQVLGLVGAGRQETSPADFTGRRAAAAMGTPRVPRELDGGLMPASSRRLDYQVMKTSPAPRTGSQAARTQRRARATAPQRS